LDEYGVARTLKHARSRGRQNRKQRLQIEAHLLERGQIYLDMWKRRPKKDPLRGLTQSAANNTKLGRFKSQFLNEADKIVNTIGKKEYQRRWGHPFPSEMCDCLRAYKVRV
jgi:hypothetical protein